MADGTTSGLTRRDRFFPAMMVLGLAVAAGIASFSESDRRGLLRWDRPAAFAASETNQPNSYDIVYLGYSRSSAIGSFPGRRTTAESGPGVGARRIIPRRGDDLGDTLGTGAPSTAIASPLAGNGPVGPGSGQSVIPALQPSGNNPAALTPFAPGNLGGIGATPPGLIAAPGAGTPPPATGDGTPPPSTGDGTPPRGTGDGTPPVVPAVPEPAAWLLMILGVGMLASALRANARRNEEPLGNPQPN